MLDQTTLKTLAQTKEIDRFSLYREYLQIRFLNEFYKNKLLTQTYFKGDTALRLIFSSSRFSEDLDFTTLISIKKLKKLLAKTTHQLKSEFPKLTIKKLTTLQGYSAKLYVPVNFASQPLTIKLDFSTRESVLEPLTSPITTDLPVTSINLVEHLSAREILSEKIRAILHRSKGRDLFDLWFLLHKKTDFQKSFIQKKLTFYSESYNHQDLIDTVQSFSQKRLDQDLNCFLPQSERKIIPQLKRLILSQLITQK